jgi:hypothetical protein
MDTKGMPSNKMNWPTHRRSQNRPERQTQHEAKLQRDFDSGPEGHAWITVMCYMFEGGQPED